MKLHCKIATAPVAVAMVTSISVCDITRLMVGVAKGTLDLQGQAIGVIAIIACMEIVASSKK